LTPGRLVFFNGDLDFRRFLDLFLDLDLDFLPCLDLLRCFLVSRLRDFLRDRDLLLDLFLDLDLLFLDLLILLDLDLLSFFLFFDFLFIPRPRS